MGNTENSNPDADRQPGSMNLLSACDSAILAPLIPPLEVGSRLEIDWIVNFAPGARLKMAVYMQGQAVGKSEEGFKGEFEGERRRVDAARLALVEEKARIAKLLEQQGERLQQEVRDTISKG